MIAGSFFGTTQGPDTSSSGAASLNQGSFTQVLTELRSAIEGEAATASFECGGSIPVNSPKTNPSDLESDPKKPEVQEPKEDVKARTKYPDDLGSPMLSTSTPVSVYWSLGENGNAKILSLPLEGSDGIDSSSLKHLVQECTPATSGRGDKDVLDTEYRSAECGET